MKKSTYKVTSIMIAVLSLAAISFAASAPSLALPGDQINPEVAKLTKDLSEANTKIESLKKENDQHNRDAQATLELVLRQRNDINSNLLNLQVILQQTQDKLIIAERQITELTVKAATPPAPVTPTVEKK